MIPRTADWPTQYKREVHAVKCQECKFWDHPTEIPNNVYADVSLAVRQCKKGKTATPTCTELPERISPVRPLAQESPGKTCGLSWCESGKREQLPIPEEKDLCSWFRMFLRDQNKTIEEVWGTEKPSGYHEWMEARWWTFGCKFIKSVPGYTTHELYGLYLVEFTEWMDEQYGNLVQDCLTSPGG